MGNLFSCIGLFSSKQRSTPRNPLTMLFGIRKQRQKEKRQEKIFPNNVITPIYIDNSPFVTPQLIRYNNTPPHLMTCNLLPLSSESIVERLQCADKIEMRNPSTYSNC